MEKIDDVSLVLYANRALWGEVWQGVRAVYVICVDREIRIKFVVDGELKDHDKESISCVGAELTADFPDFVVVEDAVRIDAPDAIPANENWLTVYRRREL